MRSFFFVFSIVVTLSTLILVASSLVSAERCDFHTSHYTCSRDDECNWCSTNNDFGGGGCCLDIPKTDAEKAKQKAGDYCTCNWSSQEQEGAQLRFFFGVFVLIFFLRFYIAYKRQQELRMELEREQQQENGNNNNNINRERVIVRRIITIRGEDGQEHDEEVEQEIFDTSAVGQDNQRRQQQQQPDPAAFFFMNQILNNARMFQQRTNNNASLPVARHTTPDFAGAQVEMGMVIDDNNENNNNSNHHSEQTASANTDVRQELEPAAGNNNNSSEETTTVSTENTSTSVENETPPQQLTIAPPRGYALQK